MIKYYERPETRRHSLLEKIRNEFLNINKNYRSIFMYNVSMECR